MYQTAICELTGMDCRTHRVRRDDGRRRRVLDDREARHGASRSSSPRPRPAGTTVVKPTRAASDSEIVEGSPRGRHNRSRTAYGTRLAGARGALILQQREHSSAASGRHPTGASGERRGRRCPLPTIDRSASASLEASGNLRPLRALSDREGQRRQLHELRTVRTTASLPAAQDLHPTANRPDRRRDGDAEGLARGYVLIEPASTHPREKATIQHHHQPDPAPGRAGAPLAARSAGMREDGGTAWRSRVREGAPDRSAVSSLCSASDNVQGVCSRTGGARPMRSRRRARGVDPAIPRPRLAASTTAVLVASREAHHRGDRPSRAGPRP